VIRLRGEPAERIIIEQRYVGLDLSLEQTAGCVIDESGKVVWRGPCASTPEAMEATSLVSSRSGRRSLRRKPSSADQHGLSEAAPIE